MNCKIPYRCVYVCPFSTCSSELIVHDTIHMEENLYVNNICVFETLIYISRLKHKSINHLSNTYDQEQIFRCIYVYYFLTFFSRFKPLTLFSLSIRTSKLTYYNEDLHFLLVWKRLIKKDVLSLYIRKERLEDEIVISPLQQGLIIFYYTAFVAVLCKNPSYSLTYEQIFILNAHFLLRI